MSFSYYIYFIIIIIIIICVCTLLCYKNNQLSRIYSYDKLSENKTSLLSSENSKV